MSDRISATVADGVGHVTLTRPEALNALSYDMIVALTEVFDAWRHDSEVGLIVLDGAGDRGFCAGGDIRELHGFVADGRIADAQTFFRTEYRLNAAIARYPKPVVAIMDGITMGGGIGLAGHASIRIVTERSRIAMPETRIGFSPDVGGTWLLANAPGELGAHLALNSRTMDAADAIHAGFADYFIPSERIPHVVQALAERADPGTPSEIALLFDETPDASPLAASRDWVDACYSAPTVAEIVTRLRALAETGHAEASGAADELEALSPTALTVTLAAVRRARTLPALEDVLEQEFRTVSWFLTQPDLLEGIRAQVIDKDRNPSWRPATLADLPDGTGELAIASPVEPGVFERA